MNPRPTCHEAEKEAMQQCWNDFYKTTLGPLELAEDKLHPEGCTMFTCHHTEWVSGVKTQAEKMHLWEDFSRRHYKTPQIEGHSLKATLGLVGILTLLLVR